MLEDLAELYGAVAEERGLILETQVAAPLPTRGDRELIQQAIANLIENALKFSPEGGAVRLIGERSPAGLHLIVADQGPGIPQNDVPRATERFFRGEMARHTPGFGLGLTLVRAVAQLHGGTLSLDPSNPGLRAMLTIPAVPAADPASARHGLLPESQDQNVAMGGLRRV